MPEKNKGGRVFNFWASLIDKIRGDAVYREQEGYERLLPYIGSEEGARVALAANGWQGAQIDQILARWRAEEGQVPPVILWDPTELRIIDAAAMAQFLSAEPRIFETSIDLFDSDLPEAEVLRVFKLIAKTPQHTFLVSTRRPGQMRGVLAHAVETFELPQSPIENLWLGLRAQNQEELDAGIQALLETPCFAHWLDLTPIGPIDLLRVKFYADSEHRVDVMRGGFWSPTSGFVNHHDMPGPVKFVRLRGETGPEARPLHPMVAATVVRQCLDAAEWVRFTFAGYGEWAPYWHESALGQGRRGDPDVLFFDDNSGVIAMRVGSFFSGARKIDGIEYPMPDLRQTRKPPARYTR